MPNKSIIIIGGGISGLSVLHFIKKKYAKQTGVSIQLLEKNSQPGGTIKTIVHSQGLFECGPNGFLDSKETTLQLIREIGLESSLTASNPQAKKRFLLIKNQLHEIPTGLAGLLKFKPLPFFDKLRLPLEIFVSRGDNPDESVYDFGVRRFGENFANIFLDPLVSGIYAGDVKKLHFKSVFPKIFELEQKHGSLLKGFFRSRRGDEKVPSSEAATPLGAGRLVSFPQGMAQLIDRLFQTYKNSILLNQDVQMITQIQDRFVIHANERVIHADEIFVCVPAHSAAVLLNDSYPALAAELNKISYVPVAVVGLIYRRDAFLHLPRGFGYLTPKSQNRPVLGVVFESQIFPGRVDEHHELFRVMIGGTGYPEVIRKTEEELIALAREEISAVLPLRKGELPIKNFV
ncbi:MAG TPA: protoporphyrinogen oxidase, partial [Candidatus Omnitrophota bacterium]|nr:protoporphyrinogen oxidase [Candidatus Omnitrophota bacterium]